MIAMHPNPRAFFPVVLLALVMLGPVEARYRFSILKIAESASVTYTTTVTDTCVSAGMQLAKPNTLEKAIFMEKLMLQSGSLPTPVLLGGYGLMCAGFLPLFFWTSLFTNDEYPILGTKKQCNQLNGLNGYKKVCEPPDLKIEEVFYRIDQTPEFGRDCNGPLRMDYDPGERYQFRHPDSPTRALLAWVVEGKNDNNLSIHMIGVCGVSWDSCRRIYGGLGLLAEYVMCEAEEEEITTTGAPTTTELVSLSKPSTTTTDSDDERHGLNEGVCVLLAAVCLGLILPALIMFVVLLRFRETERRALGGGLGNSACNRSFSVSGANSTQGRSLYSMSLSSENNTIETNTQRQSSSV